MPIKIEFQYDYGPSGREYTSAAVTYGTSLFRARVARDSRDQPNRPVARMKALEKAIRPLPRAQRIEVWTAWNNRNRSNHGANSAARTSGSRIMTSESTQTVDTTTSAIT